MNTPHYTHVEFFNATHEKWDRVEVKQIHRGAVVPEEFCKMAPWHVGVYVTIDLAHFNEHESGVFTEALSIHAYIALGNFAQ